MNGWKQVPGEFYTAVYTAIYVYIYIQLTVTLLIQENIQFR